MIKLTEIVTRYDECTDNKRSWVLLSMMEEHIKKAKDELRPGLESLEPGVTSFDDLGKVFNLLEINKTTLDTEAIKKELSAAEIRKVYKPTAKDLDMLERPELKELAKVEKQKQIRVTGVSST